MDSAHPVADAIRTVGLIAGGGSMGMALLVSVTYARRYLRDRRLAQVQGQTLAWRGLLPLHVTGVGISHTLLVFVAISVHVAGIGGPLRWETFFIATALVLSAVSLYLLLRWQRRIYPRHDEQPPTPPIRVPLGWGRRRRPRP